MADVQPLRALHYDPAVAGPLQDVVAPPYDVIDSAQRAALIERSPFNVVAVDLPQGEPDPYAAARELFESWQRAGRDRPRRAAGALGAHPGLRRARRPAAHASRLLLPRAHRGLRSRPRATARAHAPGPEGGPAAPDARDAREHLADLLAVLRPGERRLERARAGHERPRRGARSPTPTAPSTASGASPTPTRSPPCRPRRATPSC